VIEKKLLATTAVGFADAFAHRDDHSKRAVLDLVIAQTGKPPFNPRAAVGKFATLALKSTDGAGKLGPSWQRLDGRPLHSQLDVKSGRVIRPWRTPQWLIRPMQRPGTTKQVLRLGNGLRAALRAIRTARVPEDNGGGDGKSRDASKRRDVVARPH
jgi:hypothetical protein